MKKKNVLMMSSALVLGLGSVAVGSALVTQAGERFGMGGLGSHEAVESAMEAGDYNAWKEALGDRPMADQVTQEDFTKMQEVHDLREEGKYEEARQIQENLGFGGPRKGMHSGEGQGKFSENREEVESAMEAGDYNAWKEALGDRPMADQVTQEDFTKMQEAHELREEGKYEEARQIREELGFAGGRGMGGGGRHQ